LIASIEEAAMSQPLERYVALLNDVDHIPLAARETPALSREERATIVARVLEFVRDDVLPQADIEEEAQEALFYAGVGVVTDDGVFPRWRPDHDDIVARMDALAGADPADGTAVQDALYGLHRAAERHFQGAAEFLLGGLDELAGPMVMQGRHEAPDAGAMARARAVSIRPQPWRWSRPRVLVEHSDEAAGLAIASGLRFAGYAVAVCPGPHDLGQCPLCGSDGCATAHDADLVVSCLGFEREAAQEVIRALRTRCPNVPLLVETPLGTDPDLRQLLEGCHTLPAPATPEQVVAAVQALLGERTEENPSGA
jgi:hypothetical protein